MERLRRRVAAIVEDPDTAEALKPYYRFMCKRPCSSDEYLPTFNRPERHTGRRGRDQGVERLTENGFVANGVEYEVDCVIFASGFEISTEISRRYAIDAIDGRDGLSLFDHWRDDHKTLHGMTSRGFPNQFYMGFIQGGVSANATAMFEQQAEHIAYVIAEAQKPGCHDRRAQPGGPGRLGQTIRELAIDNSAFDLSCTPGYYNNEGRGFGEGVGSFLGDFYCRFLRLRRPVCASGATRATSTGLELKSELTRDSTIGWPSSPAAAGDWAAYALLLASRGAKVVVNDPGGGSTATAPTPDPPTQVVREITAAGGEAVVSTESVATPAGRQGDRRHGAGSLWPARHPDPQRGQRAAGAAEGDGYDDFDAVLDVHLRGAFHVVRPAFPVMCGAGYGRIVLTSSIGGLYGNHDVANYAVAKAGMIGLSNVAALEGRARREVQCIVPAAVTRMAEGIDIPRIRRWARSWWRRRWAGWRTNPVRSPARYLSPRRRVARVSWPRPRGLPPVVDDRRRRRAHRRDPRHAHRWSSPWCPTATATTSATASRWPAAPHEPCLAAAGGIRVVDLTAMVMGPYAHRSWPTWAPRSSKSNRRG